MTLLEVYSLVLIILDCDSLLSGEPFCCCHLCQGPVQVTGGQGVAGVAHGQGPVLSATSFCLLDLPELPTMMPWSPSSSQWGDLPNPTKGDAFRLAIDFC